MGFRVNTAVCRGALTAWLGVAAMSLLVFSAPAPGADEIKLLKTITAGTHDGDKLEDIAGIYAGPDEILIADGHAGTLTGFGATPTAPVSVTTKRGLFGSRRLGGVAALNDATFAITKAAEDAVTVVDRKGISLYVVGETGGADGQLREPQAVAYSARGRLYVADQGNDRIAVFSTDGLFLLNIGDAATPERLSRPTHVAVDGRERIYVLDNDGERISVFDHNGKLLKRAEAPTLTYAEDEPGFSAFAVSADGIVFLADKENGKIVQLDDDGTKVARSFGSKGEGRGQFAEVTAMAVTSDQRLIVGDSGNHKLEIYQLPIDAPEAANAEPRLPSVRLGTATKAECYQAYLLPTDILCIDRVDRTVSRFTADGARTAFDHKFQLPTLAATDGRAIAITDQDKIKVFAPDGKLRFTIGRFGSQDSEFDNIRGIYLGDKIYVSDNANTRVQIFSRDGIFLDKIVNRPNQPEVLREPGPLVVDSQKNIYVADNGFNKVRVFSDNKEFLFDIGADNRSAARFIKIIDLAIDHDDNLYVLATTATNEQVIQIYNGPKLNLAFGSYAEKRAGLTEATALSFATADKTVIAAYDSKRKQLQTFYYLQVPSRVGGLAVKGGLRAIQLKWHKVPGTFVTKYVVYGAGADTKFRKILETADHSASIRDEDGHRYTAFRVSAVSGFNVEGAPSPVRRDLFYSGFVRFQEQNFAEAADVFARAYQEDAAHAEAVEYLGHSLLAQGKTDEALRAYRDLGKLPGFELAGINLQADALLQAKEYLAARALLEQAVARKQADARTYFLCGETALLLGDTIVAVECLENSLELDPHQALAHFKLGQAYVKLGVVDKGLAEFETAVGLAPDDATIWQRSGEAYQALGKHGEALKRFARALEIDRLSAGARLGAVRSHIAQNEYDRARSIALSMSGDPAQEATGLYLLGIIALAVENPQEAVLSLSKAGRKNPNDSRIWLALADAQSALNDRPRMKEALRHAAEADATGFDGHFRLAALEYEDKEFAAAADGFAKAVALRPSHYDARLTYAQTLFALGRHKEAGDQAREAAKLEPKRIEPLILLADSAHAQGKSGDAVDSLKKALVIEPASAPLHTKLGRLYLENNIYDSAQTYLEKASLLDPKNAAPFDLLGQMYLERRLFDDAIKSFSQAVELNPSAELKLSLNTAYAEKKQALEFNQNAPRLILQDLRLDRVFSSAYKQYNQRAVGSVKVKNAGGSDYNNLKLSFFIKGYMDFANTTEIPVLRANESREFPLHAVFSNKTLSIDEDTGVQVEVRLSFYQDGREASTDITRPMTLYGKNAIQWADFNMVGSFVTPKDEALKEFVRQTINAYTPPAPLNKGMLQAMTVFDTFSALGIKYLVDPNTPYSQINAEQVDYVQFPRETLRSRSGDCDDLSVLLSAALENIGIETAMVDVPGHLFMMFNTGVPEKDMESISLQDDLLIVRDGQVWIPLEATMIATSFAESWTEGARRYREAEQAGTLKVVPLKQAWGDYVPVTLAPAAHTVELPPPERVQPLIERERRILITKHLDRLITPYFAVLMSNPKDQTARLQIGITYARNGLYDLALKEFDRLLEIDARSAEAHNGRGNVYYALKDYDRALEAYQYAEQIDPADAGIRVNIALVHYQRGQVKEAAESYREAAAMNKAITDRYKTFEKLIVN